MSGRPDLAPTREVWFAMRREHLETLAIWVIVALFILACAYLASC